MRTSRLLTVCVCVGGGCLPRGWGLPGGSAGVWGCHVTYHIMHFIVTCKLPPHQLKPSNSAVAYILLVGHVTCKACWDPPPPPQWTDRHL